MRVCSNAVFACACVGIFTVCCTPGPVFGPFFKNSYGDRWFRAFFLRPRALLVVACVAYIKQHAGAVINKKQETADKSKNLLNKWPPKTGPAV